MTSKTEATIDDLYRVPQRGKAEIVNGELVLMSPTGGVPGRAAGRIYRSLDDYERTVGGGYAFPHKWVLRCILMRCADVVTLIVFQMAWFIRSKVKTFSSWPLCIFMDSRITGNRLTDKFYDS